MAADGPVGGVSADQLGQQALHRRVRLPDYFADPVLVEHVMREGGVFLVTVRTRAGALEQVTLDEAQLRAALESAPEATELIPAESLFLLVESARIRLAYAFDPHFAVSLSGVDALPHQLEAVYDRLLPQTRLRFLLADDPGAGKTIMAGLLIKELRLRGAIDTVLVLCPAPLTIQWQDELHSKFDEVFERIDAERVRERLAGNPWEQYRRCIASIDFAKQDGVWQDLLRVPWDLVVIDEAHKCSARTYGQEVKKTQRYQLAERLSAQAERLLLLTATPHQGDPDQFTHFLRLLDPDQFAGGTLNQELLRLEGSPWFLRRMKEDLRDFDGRPLFTRRHPVTQPFELSPAEKRLYDEVTQYINQFLPRATGGRRQMSVALARTVLQRRLASSLRAIRRSLERRHARFREVLELPPDERERRLRQLGLLAEDEERESDDQDEAEQEAAATGITAAERLEDLRAEVRELERLIRLASETERLGEETKLRALRTCLDRAQFAELRDGRGKLLIFTEHRDTLEFLREQLTAWGYTSCQIHGGMNAQARKEAERTFLRDVQICVATEAAGEGINLQFCHLMINYDLPWNPNRLEQRMGRIHRIGQDHDVWVFNFVATNTVEGRILETLLRKLEEMRRVLGERVFDVIGLVLRLNDVNLEEMMREAAYNPRRLDDYLDQIERLDPERLRRLEAQTGVALAVSHVDLARVRQEDYRSAERRLMPEYVEGFFLAAAKQTGLRVEPRADGLWRVPHVPEHFRAPALEAVRRYGQPRDQYAKLTFRKGHLKQAQHLDAELVSPGHPLFAAVAEVLGRKLGRGQQGAAVFIDPGATAPYALHIFEVSVRGERSDQGGPPARPVFAQLVVLRDRDGQIELAPPDVLHDLTPADGTPLPPGLAAPGPADLRRLDTWVRTRVLHGLVEERRRARERELAIRREYLERSFGEALRVAREKWAALAERVAEGEEGAKLARDEADKRVQELEARREQKLAELAHLRLVRPGPVTYLGTALVVPHGDARIAASMGADPEVERIAMEVAMRYEREQGWEPVDVSALRDGSGFDIRSLGPVQPNGQRAVRRIEVKGRADHQGEVVLTPNEWLQARRHGETYWLYVVWGCKTGSPRLLRVQNPAGKLAPEELRVVKGYRVPVEGLILAAE